MKLVINYFLMFLIIILFCSKESNFTEGKELVFTNYANEDCSGDPIIIRAALTKPNYCFRMLWLESLKMICDKEQMNNTWADCYTSPCECDSDECKTYYNFNKCQNGTIITYSHLNYLEKDYCVVSESESDKVSLDRYRSMGVLVVKSDFCWEGIKLECNLLEYNFVDCESKKILLNAYTLTMGILYTDAGNISFYFGDANFYISPIFNQSNSLKSNIKIIFYNNILLLFFTFFILKIFIKK
ncbi:hypothetical protein DICPUDRAFT_79957 [Dictyostelium purpureum]|uniref:Uncharacterized protein n=1 Tax=Dictyostelium purpureum TaxID=5786 RepID=F0ZP48_DICPU|nr:uncharacterized protein DICPUDRAFT_79957 [Dictyostelium purpureum]EGC34310.1 hypothetical protein DICPUDRAFT_79957 [Dictyostelium purpureum]|eukprot:XP_003289192.1 hypothetical protein DICPUDRAFT_79957 [Dictyostelium purpureum]